MLRNRVVFKGDLRLTCNFPFWLKKKKVMKNKIQVICVIKIYFLSGKSYKELILFFFKIFLIWTIFSLY